MESADETELLERLVGKHAGAVHRFADAGVFFEQRYAEARLRELRAAWSPAGPPPTTMTSFIGTGVGADYRGSSSAAVFFRATNHTCVAR